MHKNHNHIWLILALVITAIGVLIWLAYWKTNNQASTIAKYNEANISHNADDLMRNEYKSDKTSTHPHHDTKMTMPMESTFKPTPSTCPYHE